MVVDDAPSDALYEAFKSWFDADDALASAVPGGLWYGLAPASVAASGSCYAEFHAVAQDRYLTTGSTADSNFYTITHIQVNVYAGTLDAAGEAGAAFDLRFKYQSPPCRWGVVSAVLPEGEFVELEESRAERGSDVWRKVLTYSVTVSR